jgi:16S rRNA (uracil1498-N3)-methyltransferase
MSERFYVNQPLVPGLVVVEGPEAHHLANVCRLHRGDRVCLFNGDGRQYPAIVDAVSRRHVELAIDVAEEPARELGFCLEVAVPLPKGDRATFLVEKLTELGVTTLVPLRTVRSVVHPSDHKLDKLQRTVIEASKQCGRNVLMQLAPLTPWADYVRRPDLPPSRRLAHPGGLHDLTVAAGRDQTVAVGPEGGFTEDEVALAREAGWHVFSLGPRILRVETAALVLAGLAVGSGKPI